MKTENKKTKETFKKILILSLGIAIGYSVAQPEKLKNLFKGAIECGNKGLSFIKHNYK